MVAVEGYNALNLLGLGPATGLVSSFATTRELAPIMIAMAFIAQAGCRFTAQLGAMRINDEIDAMDALALNPLPYLVATPGGGIDHRRYPVVSDDPGVAYLSCQLVSVIAGQSIRVIPALLLAVHQPSRRCVRDDQSRCFRVSSPRRSKAITVTSQAAARPVWEWPRDGRCDRAVTVVMIVNMLLTMALWGVEAGARFGG